MDDTELKELLKSPDELCAYLDVDYQTRHKEVIDAILRCNIPNVSLLLVQLDHLELANALFVSNPKEIPIHTKNQPMLQTFLMDLLSALWKLARAHDDTIDKQVERKQEEANKIKLM
jgi:hypothetical protein